MAGFGDGRRCRALVPVLYLRFSGWRDALGERRNMQILTACRQARHTARRKQDSRGHRNQSQIWDSLPDSRRVEVVIVGRGCDRVGSVHTTHRQK